MTFIVAFGVTKAATNYLAGTLSDRFGRKPVLVAGWLVALPVPLLLIWAPSWGWVIAANVLLGVNQGLTWSTTVIMKIDLVGPARRGLAMGLNEAAGYLAVAATALATGYLAARYGLRPAPFYLGIAYAALGLGLSTLAVRETREHARLEARTHTAAPTAATTTCTPSSPTGRSSPRPASANRHCPRPARPGMVNNLNDGLAWGLFPVLFAAAGLSVAQIGVLAALYPAVWGLGQLVTGALSDRIGRKPLIVAGMLLQAVALGLVAAGHTLRAVGGRRRPARRRHRDGLPDPARRHRRRRPPRLAGPRGRGLPPLARRRLRRRRAARRRTRRRLRHPHRHLGRRRTHRRLRAHRRGPHVRNPPAGHAVTPAIPAHCNRLPRSSVVNDADADADVGGYTTLEQADELAACWTSSQRIGFPNSTGAPAGRRRTRPRSAALRRC